MNLNIWGDFQICISVPLSEKKYGGKGLLSQNKETLYAEPNERPEKAISSYSEAVYFLQHICSVLVAKSHQKIRSGCLVHEFSITDVF